MLEVTREFKILKSVTMKKNIGRGLLYFGIALILATTIRTMVDMLKIEKIDLWSVMLAIGLIVISIGVGLLKK